MKLGELIQVLQGEQAVHGNDIEVEVDFINLQLEGYESGKIEDVRDGFGKNNTTVIYLYVAVDAALKDLIEKEEHDDDN